MLSLILCDQAVCKLVSFSSLPVRLLVSGVQPDNLNSGCCHVAGLVAKSCPTLATPWTAACQVPLGFPRQEYWSGLPFPSSGDLPNPGIESGSPALPADSLPTEPPGKPSCFVTTL